MEVAKMRNASACLVFLVLSVLIIPFAGASPHDVIVVRGDIPTDYVAASIYAHSAGIPIVLVNPDNIPGDIGMELRGYSQSGYQSLLIIGGEEAISAGVENSFKAMGFSTSRLWDWNRYGTAARVAIDLWGEAESCVSVTGESYQDFLVAQRTALKQNIPVLFSMNSSLTQETRDALERLGVVKALLVGSGEISQELGGLGITAETIDVNYKEPGKGAPPLDLNAVITYSLLIVLCLIILAALVYMRRIFRDRVSIPSMVLTPDEQEIVKAIKNSYGAVRQNKLPGATGFSRPRICRLVKALEDRGVIKREKKKKTYVLKMKSRVI